MKILLVRYPEVTTEDEVKRLRAEMKGAINACVNGEVGLALIREDVEVAVLNLDADVEYEDEEEY